MKFWFSFLCMAFIGMLLDTGSTAQVGIGTNNPDASSGLDVDYTNKGLLHPRMTTIQRDAIVDPADGLMIFNTTTGCPNYFFSGSWYEYCGTLSPPAFFCGTSSVTFTYNGTSVTYGTVLAANNKCWLDRNLGASQVASSTTDAASYGHLFQWGRLDDGHQIRTSPTTTTLSTSDVPGHGSFIRVSTSPYDWRSPQNNNLWQGVNGINNPCPSGFRLPTQTEWNNELTSWSSNNAAGAFASALKLPLTGGRNHSDGLVSYEGTYGFYWSSTVYDIYAWFLRFYSDDAEILSNFRAFGFAARCIKD